MTEKTVIKFKKPRKAETRRERIPCLVVVEGNNIGEVYHLSKKVTTIGRGDEVDILLPEEGVSRLHARIDLHENTFTLNDLKSTNGTFVNGEPMGQAILHDGDKIRLGDVVLRFSYQDMLDVDYQERLRNMAMRDGLTKVFNRRHFMDTLAREINFALRKRQPLTCLLFDIDHFKKVNDNFGHPAGDMILRKLGHRLASEIRGYDLVARYGGEEFIILLRSTALENGLIFAERVRSLVADMSTDYEGKELRITISVGVAALDPDRAVTADDLVKQADRFLYQAKQQGRNRVASIRSAVDDGA